MAAVAMSTGAEPETSMQKTAHRDTNWDLIVHLDAPSTIANA
jgi:hypothetical protein